MVLEPAYRCGGGDGPLAVDCDDLLLVGEVDEDGGLAGDAYDVGLEHREAEEHGGPGVDGVAPLLEGVVASLRGEVVG